MRWARDGDRRPDRRAAVICLGLTVVFLPACDSMGRRGGADRPTASAVRDPVLRDLPKPQGFALDLDRSIWFASGKYRLARCEYAGGLDRSQVKNFYEEYMPSAGFELRESSLDQGVYVMRFESTAEVCEVRVRPGDWGKSAVVVAILPKAQGATERESKPPVRRPQ